MHPGPGTTTVQQRALERAAALLGGGDALCRQLKVSPQRLAGWLKGLEPLPDAVFLQVVDILSDAQEPLRPI